MEGLVFYGWERAGGALHGDTNAGRLKATVKLEARAVETGEAQGADVAFEFYGPRDVAGFLAGAVTSISPVAGAQSAEETMCAFVELGAPDVPWRYAPVPAEAANASAWKPWIVLVVGSTRDVVLLPGNRVAISQAVAYAHPLGQSARWAHVQKTNPPAPLNLAPHITSRLLSPYELKPNTDYIAVVVPAFTDDGNPAWDGNSDVESRVFYSWRFRTGDAGDFKDLALRLHTRNINDPLIARLGSGHLEYPLHDRANVLMVRSALVPPAVVPASGIDPDGHAPSDVAAANAEMRLPAYDKQGRHIVQLPRYGDAWVDDPLSPAGGWGAMLNGEPRHRVAAGAGMWCGVEQQDLIADAARERAAGLFIAAQRIRALTAGLAAGGSLWSRRLPSTPQGRLALFGPALARVAATGAGDATVLGSITDPDSGRNNGRPMPPALFSSAARRLLRPGTARARQAKPGALAMPAIIDAANRCDRLARVPAPSRARDGGDSQRGLPHADFLARDIGPVQGGRDDEGLRNLLFALARQEQRLPRCRPVDIARLDSILQDAFRPDRNGVAARRVLDTITGLDPAEPFSPPEICPDLDLPAWAFLRDGERKWLLLGREAIQPDDVVALASNARFVNAFLVGLNTQALGEMRWRNIPVRSGCTPLRRFWGRVNAAPPITAATDIVGIRKWNTSEPLGHPDHSPYPTRQLVMVFRTDLFRRYPRTLVYVTPAAKDGAGKPDWMADAPLATKTDPVFTGEIDEDLVFFGFPMPPEELADKWVVVEEAPPGYRFRVADLLEDIPDPPAPKPPLPRPLDGGISAQHAFALPTRVLFRGDQFLAP